MPSKKLNIKLTFFILWSIVCVFNLFIYIQDADAMNLLSIKINTETDILCK
jgi:hypothetical protein